MMALKNAARRVTPNLARLTPRRVARSAVRRTFEWRVARRAGLAGGEPTIRLGNAYGGWAVPAGGIGPDWSCCLVGAGSDISFDLALIARFGCRVLCVDPGDASAEMVREAAATEPRLSFAQVALTPTDGEVRLFRAEDPESGSLSAVNLLGGTSTVNVPGRSLATLMAENGLVRTDLLKLDIEGSEYDVLESLDLVALGVRVLLVELHRTVSTGRAFGLIDRLRAQGYVAVGRSGADYTFVRSEGARSRRAGRAATGLGAVVVGYAASTAIWCGPITGVVCLPGAIPA